jgi:hypothetical protein
MFLCILSLPQVRFGKDLSCCEETADPSTAQVAKAQPASLRMTVLKLIHQQLGRNLYADTA